MHELGARVVDAVRELLLGEAPGEWDADRARPLGRPVEKRRLEPVVEHDGHARAGRNAQPPGDAGNPWEELVVADPGERLALRMPLAGGEERLREVHRASSRACAKVSRASSIAATMGA